MSGAYMTRYYKLSIRRELVDFVMNLAEEEGTPYTSAAEAMHDSLRLLARDMQKKQNDKRSLSALEKETVPAEAE